MREALDSFGDELDVLVNNVGTNIRKPTVAISMRARARARAPLRIRSRRTRAGSAARAAARAVDRAGALDIRSP